MSDQTLYYFACFTLGAAFMDFHREGYFHWILHFLRMQPTRIAHRIIDGHKWIVGVCTICEKEKPLAHSTVCDCKTANKESGTV